MGTEPDEECMTFILRTTTNEAYTFLKNGLAEVLASYAQRGGGATDPVVVSATVLNSAFDELQQRCKDKGIELEVVDVELVDGMPAPDGLTTFSFTEDMLAAVMEVSEGLVADSIEGAKVNILPPVFDKADLDEVTEALKRQGLGLAITFDDADTAAGGVSFKVVAPPNTDIVTALKAAAAQTKDKGRSLMQAIENAYKAEQACQASRDAKEKMRTIEKVR